MGPGGGPIDPSGRHRFIPQVGSPVATVNFIDPAGCAWLGIAGQVFTIDARVLPNLVIEVNGNLGGKEILLRTLTGDQTALGPGGFLAKIAEKPVGSKNTLWVQLFDQDGKAMSQRIYLDTFDSCDKNLVLINFTEVMYGAGAPVFLPTFLNQP